MSSPSVRVITVPRVQPIENGRITSFSAVLKMERAVDALIAGGGLAQHEVPRAAVPVRLLRPGFEDAKTFKLPASALLGPGTRGTVYAVRLEGGGRDHLTLFTPQGHRLAVRQASGDYPAGFFWTNYQVK